MFPPQQSISVDLAALSGICGSISIACWVVVFSPQIIENFRRSSAEGLSMTFLIIWLAGDFFNILGGVLQGILPTMIILAVYYTLADIVLILQTLYYRGFLTRPSSSKANGTINGAAEQSETQPLLHGNHSAQVGRDEHHHRSSSLSQLHHHVDATHLSPATPLHRPSTNEPPIAAQNLKPASTTQTILFNLTAIILVCAAGAFGWWVSTQKLHHPHHRKHHTEEKIEYPEFDTWGQVFGYFCAILYLGSRIPQILLNFQRKSTEGVSLLFFLFACIGNLTYDLSIFAYDPTPLCEGRGLGRCEDGEAATIYARYIAVNASWIAGSLGTLLLDMCIFVQFFLYRKEGDDDSDQDTDDVAVVDDT